VFSVTGSVSGAQASATAADPYSITETAFTVINGSADFVIGDTFSYSIAVSTAEWSVLESDLVSSQKYVILKGVGGGSDEIFVGFRTWSNGSTYFNLESSSFSGYVNGNSYDDQPGKFHYFTCFSNVAFDYWMIFTGRHIKVVGEIGTINEHLYTGWFLPNATQSQYAYPACVGGNTDDSAQLVGGTETDHTAYWAGVSTEESFAVNDGTSWVGISKFIPKDFGDFGKWFDDIDGDRTSFALEAVETSTNNIYGRLEGVYAVVNGDSALTPRDVINDGQRAIVIFQDTYRTGTINVIGLDLMGDN
jgi:hypothetical protein